MSLWFEQLRVGFCADRLVCVRLSRGFRPAVLEKREIAVASEGESSWSGALEQLQTLLSGLKGRQPLHSVVLSGRFVRHLVLPWQPSLMRRREREVYARHVFKETFGVVAMDWDVTVSDEGFGHPVLAAAVDQKLLAGLRGIYQGRRLQSIQPYLTLAYGQFRKSLSKNETGPTYFGVVENGEFGLIRQAKGQLSGVFHQRIQGSWQTTLQSLLLQAAGPDEGSRSIHMLAPGRDEIGLVGATRINRLSVPVRHGYSPLSDPAFAMGMVGVS